MIDFNIGDSVILERGYSVLVTDMAESARIPNDFDSFDDVHDDICIGLRILKDGSTEKEVAFPKWEVTELL